MSRLMEEELAAARRLVERGLPTAYEVGLLAEVDALRAERDAAVNAAQGIAAKLIPELDEAERRGFEACREAAVNHFEALAATVTGADYASAYRHVVSVLCALQPSSGTARTQGSGTAVTVREQKGKR